VSEWVIAREEGDVPQQLDRLHYLDAGLVRVPTNPEKKMSDGIDIMGGSRY
jgi:hypothetical protein